MIKKLFINTFLEAEEERTISNSSVDHTALDKKLVTIFIVTAVCLSMMRYLGEYSFLRECLTDLGANGLLIRLDSFIYSFPSNLGGLLYWVTMAGTFYFIVPAFVIRFLFKERLSDYGLRTHGAFKDVHLYLIMLMVMIPLVLYFSTTTSFQHKYPFFDMNGQDKLFPNFWKWELMYCFQFFALEFFFRGFVLHGLKQRMGFYSIFAMTVPYCMIHFGKPLPETLAAIIAGVVLGCLSLKSRSVWLGFLIHTSVGLSMDLASMWRQGFFG